MKKINLLVANANSAFTEPELGVFQKAAEKAEAFISSSFNFDYEVDIVIATPSQLVPTIPEDGIGGKTFHSRLIMISIDKKQRIVNENIAFETMCHEMSHSLRWEKLPEYADSLFDSMIMEGLAVVLAEKALKDAGQSEASYFLSKVQKTTQAEIDKMMGRLQDNFNDKNYDYDKLFFTGDENLPRWTGYKLGYYFVNKYLERTGETVDEATLASYGDFEPENHKTLS